MRALIPWILAIGMLIVAAAAVYVVGTVAFTTGGPGSPYAIPEGRYDCFMFAQNIIMTEQFPPPRPESIMPLPPKPEYEQTADFLGRELTIGVYGRDPAFSRIAVQQVLRRVEKIAAMADTSNPESELSIINRTAADRPVVMSPDMHYLIKRTLEISAKSKGAFDVTTGPLRDLWSACAARGMAPTPLEIRDARALVGSAAIQIDDSRRVIRFKKKGITIDLRDVIGGFAADQAAHALLVETVTSGYVRIGDCWRLLAHPQAEAEQTWIMGVPDPNPSHRGGAGRSFSCDRGAVVSKGYYTGYQFVGGTPISDIIDARTGTCAAGVAVCTVVGPDALSCDAMATTLVSLGGTQAAFFVSQFNPKETAPKPRKPADEEEQ